MDFKRGIRRLKFVGLMLMTFLALIVLAILFHSSPFAQAIGPYALLLFLLGVLGVLIFVVAWVWEGFMSAEKG